MEAGFIALVVLVTLVLGTVIGVLIGKRNAERQYSTDTKHIQGTLSVDCSDPDFEPNLFLALSVPVDAIVSRQYVTLDVKVFTQNSHE